MFGNNPIAVFNGSLLSGRVGRRSFNCDALGVALRANHTLGEFFRVIDAESADPDTKTVLEPSFELLDTVKGLVAGFHEVDDEKASGSIEEEDVVYATLERGSTSFSPGVDIE